MTDYNYEAVVETDRATFTFRGDKARVVRSQAASLPVKMHASQIKEGVDLTTDIEQYMEQIAEEHRRKHSKRKNKYKPRHNRDD